MFIRELKAHLPCRHEVRDRALMGLAQAPEAHCIIANTTFFTRTAGDIFPRAFPAGHLLRYAAPLTCPSTAHIRPRAAFRVVRFARHFT
jgi:hypothetical protein